MKKKPILCLDFDGVIHSYTSGWMGAHVIPDPPVPGAFAFIAAAVERFDVHVFSSRSNQPGGLDAMKEWFAHHMATPAWLDAIKWPTEKPAAMITLDDRAITFTGEWPEIDTLLAFKPWHQR